MSPPSSKFMRSIVDTFERLTCLFAPKNDEYVNQAKKSTIVVQAPRAVKQMTIVASKSTDQSDKSEDKIECHGQSLPAQVDSAFEKTTKKSKAKFNIKKWFHHIKTKNKNKNPMMTAPATAVVVQYCTIEKVIDGGSDTVPDIPTPITDTAGPLSGASSEPEVLKQVQYCTTEEVIDGGSDTVPDIPAPITDIAAPLPGASSEPEVIKQVQYCTTEEVIDGGSDTVPDIPAPITDTAAPLPGASSEPEVLKQVQYCTTEEVIDGGSDTVPDIPTPITDIASPLPGASSEPEVIKQVQYCTTEEVIDGRSDTVPDISAPITDTAAPLCGASSEPEVIKQQCDQPGTDQDTATAVAVAAIIAAAIAATATATTTLSEASDKVNDQTQIKFTDFLKGLCNPIVSAHEPTITSANVFVEVIDRANDKVSGSENDNDDMQWSCELSFTELLDAYLPVEGASESPDKASLFASNKEDDNSPIQSNNDIAFVSSHETVTEVANSPAEGENKAPEKVSDTINDNNSMQNLSDDDETSIADEVADDTDDNNCAQSPPVDDENKTLEKVSDHNKEMEWNSKWNSDVSFTDLLNRPHTPPASAHEERTASTNHPSECDGKDADMHEGLFVSDMCTSSEPSITPTTTRSGASSPVSTTATTPIEASSDNTIAKTEPANDSVEAENKTPKTVSDNNDGYTEVQWNPEFEKQWHPAWNSDVSFTDLLNRPYTPPISASETRTEVGNPPAGGEKKTPEKVSDRRYTASISASETRTEVGNPPARGEKKTPEKVSDRPYTAPISASETRTEVGNPPAGGEKKTREKVSDRPYTAPISVPETRTEVANLPVEGENRAHEAVSDNNDGYTEMQWNPEFEKQWSPAWNSDVSFTDLLNRPYTPPIVAQRTRTEIASPPVEGEKKTDEKVSDRTDGNKQMHWNPNGTSNVLFTDLLKQPYTPPALANEARTASTKLPVLFTDFLKQPYTSPALANEARTASTKLPVEGEKNGVDIREGTFASDMSTPSPTTTIRSGTLSPVSTTATTPIEAPCNTHVGGQKGTLGRGPVPVSVAVSVAKVERKSDIPAPAPVTRYLPVAVPAPSKYLPVAVPPPAKYITAFAPLKDYESQDKSYFGSAILGSRAFSRFKSVLSSSLGSGTESNETMTDILSSFPVSIGQVLMTDLNSTDLFRGTCDHANPMGCTNCSNKIDYLKRMRDAFAALRYAQLDEKNMVTRARDMALQGRWK
ncbi:hypothetical protein V1525DRAFT_389674 [Lipomyces kononenkoae]|uniref:Uncharacterized protein n=1 Tax=Lipomyces kononenkoae TaxID=34357 RepID=A0ACC3SZQ3_LIPKO